MRFSALSMSESKRSGHPLCPLNAASRSGLSPSQTWSYLLRTALIIPSYYLIILSYYHDHTLIMLLTYPYHTTYFSYLILYTCHLIRLSTSIMQPLLSYPTSIMHVLFSASQSPSLRCILIHIQIILILMFIFI